MSDYLTIHQKLAAFRLPLEELEFRPGATSPKGSALALAYADPRAYQDVLDDICPEWEVRFIPWGERRVICELTICGVTRSSTGEEGDSPGGIAGTAAEAQSFKRACSAHGLMRYLYSLPQVWVAWDSQKKQFTEDPATKLRQKMPRQAQEPSHDEAVPPRARKRITPERAQAMAIETSKLGINDKDRIAIARNVTGNLKLNSFKELFEDEIEKVWWELKKHAKVDKGMPQNPNKKRTDLINSIKELFQQGNLHASRRQEWARNAIGIEDSDDYKGWETLPIMELETIKLEAQKVVDGKAQWAEREEVERPFN